MQETAYNNFIQTYHTKYDWVAFFDIDEFLVLKKHKNIKEFIGDYSNYYAIGINWVYFGDNGILFDGNYSLISRFTKRQIGVDSHVKCIIKLDPRIEYSIHQPKNFEVVDTNFNTFTGPFNPIGDDNIAHINHYYCRTWEEWINKKNRGRADVPLGHNEHFISDILFFERNLNDIEDTSALDFYLK